MLSKYKRFYLVYIILLFVYFILSNAIIMRVTINSRLNSNILAPQYATLITLILIGALIGLEHLYNEFKKSGVWKINIYKLLILGIPCLTVILLLIAPLFFVNLFPVLQQKVIRWPYPLEYIRNSTYSLPSFLILLGWILTTSFYKA